MQVNKIDITYVGISEELIHILLNHRLYNLRTVITVKGKLGREIFKILQRNKIQMIEISKMDEMEVVRKSICTDVVIMYKFGFIIPEDIINAHIFFNIHWGDLRTNRGAHSLRWTILLREPTTKMTLYQIDGVDEGIIVGEETVYVDEKEDVVSLERKMNAQIHKLLEKTYEYLHAEDKCRYEAVYGGQYRKKIQEIDYLIDITRDGYLEILHKINAVKDFGGAVIFIDEKKYRVFDVVLWGDNQLNYEKSDEIKVVNAYTTLNEKIRLLCKEYILIT